MDCVYCHHPIPGRWYEYHCIPVARLDDQWVDMYNRLNELAQPVEHVAHWSCHVRQQQATSATQHLPRIK